MACQKALSALITYKKNEFFWPRRKNLRLEKTFVHLFFSFSLPSSFFSLHTFSVGYYHKITRRWILKMLVKEGSPYICSRSSRGKALEWIKRAKRYNFRCWINLHLFWPPPFITEQYFSGLPKDKKTIKHSFFLIRNKWSKGENTKFEIYGNKEIKYIIRSF